MSTFRQAPVPGANQQWITPTQAVLWQQFIVQAYDFGLLDQQQMEELLRAYILRDPDGGEWTMSAETRQWYRRDDQGQWVPAEPPPSLAPPLLDFSALRGAESPVLREAEALERPAEPVASAPPVLRVAPARPELRRVTAAPKSDDCPNCGASMPGKKFCTNCGTKLV